MCTSRSHPSDALRYRDALDAVVRSTQAGLEIAASIHALSEEGDKVEHMAVVSNETMRPSMTLS